MLLIFNFNLALFTRGSTCAWSVGIVPGTKPLVGYTPTDSDPSHEWPKDHFFFRNFA